MKIQNKQASLLALVVAGHFIGFFFYRNQLVFQLFISNLENIMLDVKLNFICVVALSINNVLRHAGTNVAFVDTGEQI